MKDPGDVIKTKFHSKVVNYVKLHSWKSANTGEHNKYNVIFITLLNLHLNPLLPSAAFMRRSAKILILI